MKQIILSLFIIVIVFTLLDLYYKSNKIERFVVNKKELISKIDKVIDNSKKNNKTLRDVNALIDNFNEEQLESIDDIFSEMNEKDSRIFEIKKYLDLYKTNKNNTTDTTIKSNNLTTGTINDMDEKVKEILGDYYKKNKQCSDKMNNDPEYAVKVQKHIKIYIESQFIKNIGKIPDKDNLINYDSNESVLFINILKKLPNCSDLIKFHKDTGGKNIKIDNTPKKDNLINQVKDIGNELQNDSYKFTENALQKNTIVSKNKSIVKNTSKNIILADKTLNKITNDNKKTEKKKTNKIKGINNENEYTINKLDSYGWSYMSPEYWMVPNQAPPICINNTKPAIVKPLLDKGTPVNALNWQKNGGIVPRGI